MSLFIRAPRTGLPCVTDVERASRAMADLRDRSMASSDPDLVEWVRAITDDPAGRDILESIFSNSPFLTACALSDIPLLMQVLTQGPDSTFGRMIGRIKDAAFMMDLRCLEHEDEFLSQLPKLDLSRMAS